MVMARFARDCLQALGPLLRKLEVELGPDTAELGLRVGLNSGPVTVNLPAGSSVTAGDTITIKDGNGTGGTNNITVSPNGTDEINGVNADVILNTANAYITLYSNGTHWHIIGQG